MDDLECLRTMGDNVTGSSAEIWWKILVVMVLMLMLVLCF